MEKEERAGLCFIYFCLMMSSLLTHWAAAGSDLPCPSPCKCHKENYQPYGDVNAIVCSDLELTAVPDLSSLKTSPIPNNVALERNKIQEISRKDFPPGLKIIMMNLNENLGMNISDDTFLNMGISLKELSLEAVNIVYDKTLIMLDSLFSLEKLSLNNNNKHPYTVGAVQDVTATLFQGEVAKRLKNLQLAFSSIRTLSGNSLENLVNLEELDLSNTWLTAVPAVALKKLTKLKFVQFHYCNILSLKNNDFASLSNLERIDLSTNSQLASIEDKAFSGLENSLRKLSLQRCSLSKFPTKAFEDLTKLTFLDVSENKFVDIASGSMKGKYKLTELIISSVGMKFTPGMFEGQTSNIAQLSIPRMNLKAIPKEALKTLTRLRRLSMEYNAISSLPAKAFDGIKATSFILDNNPVQNIAPGAFDGLPPNLVISISRNTLADLSFLMGYEEGAINSVKLEDIGLECQCSLRPTLNVTHTIEHVFGYCKHGEKRVFFNSQQFEPAIEEACEEERRNNSGNGLAFHINTWIVSLVFLCAVIRLSSKG